MADMTKGLKGIWMKGMEAISDTATKIAANTKYKVNEMNVVNRRAEILKDFGVKSYELWQKGEQFPAELDALLKELHGLETELGEIRAQKAAARAVPTPAPEEKEEPAEEKTFAEKVEDVIEDVAEKIEDAVEGDDDQEEAEESAEVPVIVVEEEAIPEEEAAPEAEEEVVPEIKVEE